MIIMINGSFGVGKTTIAQKLVTSIPNSMLYDPEEVGFMLRNLIPEHVKNPCERTDDFQDLTLWKSLTVDVARSIQKTYKRHLIVPMTIYQRPYLQYIRNGFKQFDQHIFHFCLVAETDIVYERLRKRGEIEGNWAFQQVRKCVEAFRDESFKEHIHTDFLHVDDVVKQIRQRIGNSDALLV